MGEARTPGESRAPWLVALAVLGAIGALVGVVAGIGGFETVAEPGPASVELGEQIEAAMMTITVEQVAVMDELDGSGSFPDVDAGERVLAVLLTVTNLDDEPRPSWRTGSLDDYRLEHRPDDMPSIKAFGDVDFNLVELQPDVPTTVVLTWVVSAAEATESVQVIISDAAKGEVGAVSGSVMWDELPPAATVTAVPEDLGVGAPW